MWFSDFFNDKLGAFSVFCSFMLLCLSTFYPKELPFQKALKLLTAAFPCYMLAAGVDVFQRAIFDLGITPAVYVFTRLSVSLAATLLMLAAAAYVWKNKPPQSEFVFAFISVFLVGAWLEIFIFNEFETITFFENLLPVFGLLFVCAAFVFQKPFKSAQGFIGVVLGGFAALLSYCGVYGVSVTLPVSTFFVLLSWCYMLLRIEALEKEKFIFEDVLSRTIFNLDGLSLPALLVRAENGSLLAANSVAERLFYLSANELWRYHFQDLFVDEKAYDVFMRQLQENRHAEGEILGKAVGSAMPFWLNGSANEVLYRGEKVIYAVFEEQIILKKIEAFVNRKNHLDLLTGVFHQAYFKKTVSVQIKQAQKQRELSCLMLVDIDGFGQINQDFSTLTGDRALMELATLLCRRFEQKGVVGRVGADAFAVYFRGVDAIGLERMAVELMTEVRKLKILTAQGKPLAFSLSQGLISRQNDDYEALYQKALEALNYAKLNGGRQFVSYKPSFAKKSILKRQEAPKIHPALTDEELTEVSLLDDSELMRFRA